jgi:HD-GYP domain-containing protein (c-di-GMP phosphodiesterase class II)
MLVKRLGQELKLGPKALEDLEIAGMLHDIGKIGIDDAILTKKGGLTDEEYSIMKSHPTISKKILEPIGLSKEIIDGVYLHHKRYDLKGYPVDEKLDVLMLYPSVIGVADAFDAMTSNRTYSKEKSIADAMSEINKYKGSQFSPAVVEALEKILEEDESSIQAIIR